MKKARVNEPINIIKMDTNLAFQIEKSNTAIQKCQDCIFQSQLIIFRKEMSLINVYVSTDRLTYRLPTDKLAESCVAMANKIIEKHGLYALETFHPNMATALVIKRRVSHDL